MPPPYMPVGICIYCGAARYNDKLTRKLGDEHIIPANIRGNIVLPEASCASCEAETSKIEDFCAKGIFGNVRPHLGVRGRASKKIRDQLAVRSVDGSGKLNLKKVPSRDHPALLVLPKFSPPAFMAGVRGSDAARMELFVRALHVERVDPNIHYEVNGIQGIKFARFIAKIAHSYAIAEVGAQNALWFLQKIVIGSDLSGLFRFVGGTESQNPPAESDVLHELKAYLRILNEKLLVVVEIRLFSSVEGVPIYQVVAGQAKTSAIGKVPLQI